MRTHLCVVYNYIGEHDFSSRFPLKKCPFRTKCRAGGRGKEFESIEALFDLDAVPDNVSANRSVLLTTTEFFNLRRDTFSIFQEMA